MAISMGVIAASSRGVPFADSPWINSAAEGMGGRGSVGRQSWEGHHCLITAMLVTSS
ncbi:hypothetical protein NQZ68_000987 [Dissostichus eleginoides]|nr:hypothetical protein NQZ68_000987 [Dissostichus eleginoides]